MVKPMSLARRAMRAEWHAWNPVTGCSKISPGCDACYAERLARRMQAEGHPNYLHGFRPTIHEQRLEQPLHWTTPRWIAVNSMSDVFHEDIPTEYIRRIVRIITQTPHHQYLILTKRSGRMRLLSQEMTWPENLWLGVSVESTEYLSRVDDLRQTRAVHRVVSFEPLLEPIEGFDPTGLAWVQAGHETGPLARPCLGEWIQNLRAACRSAGVPFHDKQAGPLRGDPPPAVQTLGWRRVKPTRSAQPLLF